MSDGRSVRMPLDTHARLGDTWRNLPWRYCSGSAVVVTATSLDEAEQIQAWAYLISPGPTDRPLTDGGPVRRW